MTVKPASLPDPPGIRSLSGAFHQMGSLQKAARAVGITLPQAAALVALATREEMSAGEIGDALGITSGPVTSLTAGLLRRHLIRRRPDPADLRSVLFALTEHGERCLAAYMRSLEGASWERQGGSGGAE